MKALKVIGAALGVGAQIHSTKEAPAYFKKNGLVERLAQEGIPLEWDSIIEEANVETIAGKPYDHWPQVSDFVLRLQAQLKKTIETGDTPLVLGGDHAIAMGTWPGVIKAKGLQQNFGLLWLDAHMDAHTPDTTPSGAMHGMPVAGLLGYGDTAWGDALSGGPFLKPEHLIMIGIRSFEPGEAALLGELGVQIYDMNEVNKRGFETVFAEALATLRSRVSCYGMTIDLDAFDPKAAPGVGSPEHTGLLPEQVLPALALCHGDAALQAVEIAEYNPVRDQNGKTAQLAESLIRTLFK